MNKTSAAKESKYPWAVCAACAMVFFTSIGMTPGTFSVHAPFMIDQWGLTNVQNSTIVSVRTFVGLVTMFFCGAYYKKLSLRMGMTLGVLLGAIGFGVFAFADTFAMGCVAAVFTGACYGFAGSIPVSVILVAWFNRHRMLAMSISFAASGFAAMLVPPIATYLILRFSLRTAFLCEGIFVLIMAALAYAILRDKPEDLGLLPLGGSEELEEKKEKKRVKHLEQYAPNKVSLALMFVVTFLIGAMNYTAYNHFSVLYSTSGWDAQSIALLMSLAGCSLLLGKVLCGQLIDLFSARKTAFIFFGFTFISMIMAAMAANPNFGLHIATMLIYGLGGVLATTGISAYALDLSTKETYGDVVRYSYVIYGASGVVCSFGMGLIADLTGSYVPAYIALAALTILAFILLQTAYRLAAKK
ncbi:MAG: MFS transporter [Clostridiales Family XIII bacterium]|nr:MFS transporter [Clostridia bacterium]MDY3010093.1 MFS transporter [Clostridiales Family XIII bacterium]